MKTLEEYLAKARKEKWAVPHFNFSSTAQLNGIIEAVRAMKAPVLLGTSEGERKFLGIDQAVALVRSFQKEGMAVFLNADHCHSFESAKEAVDAGYDSVHIDLSKESLQDNLQGTTRVVEYAKGVNPEISVEGELGYLATDSSKIYHKEVTGKRKTNAMIMEMKTAAYKLFITLVYGTSFESIIPNILAIIPTPPRLRLPEERG